MQNKAPVILLADDDLGFQEIVGTTLKRNGFIVAEAHDGEEAVEKATNLHPSLILLDINMPKESGTEALLDLMKNKETRDIKIVFLTSEENPWPAAEGKNKGMAEILGAKDYINKTEDLHIIVDKIKEYLKQG